MKEVTKIVWSVIWRCTYIGAALVLAKVYADELTDIVDPKM